MPPTTARDTVLRDLLGVFAYVAHVDSLLAVAGLALVLSGLEWMGRLPGTRWALAFLAARLVWGSYFFLVARKAARGRRRLPVPADFLDTWDELIVPLAQALLATLWCWLALAAQVRLTGGLLRFLDEEQAHPVSYLVHSGAAGQALLAGGILYLPAALLGPLVARRVLPVADPTLGPSLAARLGPTYVVTFALLCALGLLGYTVDTAAVLLESALPIPLATAVASHLLRLPVPLAQARLLGELCWRHREVLDASRHGG